MYRDNSIYLTFVFKQQTAMRCFVFFLLFFAGAAATAQPSHVLGKPYVVKYLYLDSLWELCTHPDSNEISHTLPAIEKWVRDKGDLELATELALLNVRFQLLHNTDDSIAAKLEAIARYSKEHKLYKVQANALKLLGELWSARNKYAEAFENDLAAYHIYSGFSPDEFPQKQCYLYTLGTHYMQYGDEENALKLYREAKATADPIGRWTKLVNNAIGLYYRKTGKYDSARLYFQQIYDDAVKANEQPWIGIAAGNIGICFFYEKKYDEALPLLEKDIQYSIATSQIKNAIGSMTIISEIYFIQGDVQKSEKTLYAALALGTNKAWWPNYKLVEPIYRLLSRVYARQNNMRLAYLYSDSANIAKDSILHQFNALSLVKAQERALMAKRQIETEQLNYQRKIHILTRNGLIAGIILLTAIGFLLISRQMLKQKKLKAELSGAATQLENFRQNILDKNNIIDKFVHELERIKENNTESDVDVLTQLQNAIILTDQQWEDFQRMFEKVHKNFLSSLKKKFPDLTPAETRLLVLTKLKLSSKEMASMMGISPNTIRIYRHRLRRKLDLDKEEMIEELVENI